MSAVRVSHADVIVVGGGVAGLAAATALAESGTRVLVLEARPYLGGRALSWLDPDTGAVVDNGQHLFMGCYQETLRLLDRVGSREGLHLQPRLEVTFADPGGRLGVFRSPGVPHPVDQLLGLLRFPGLSLRERIGLTRVVRSARRGHPGKADEDSALDDQSVAELLASLGQTAAANSRLWHPLVVATLNEDPSRASAAMMMAVLRGAFGTGRDGSRLGLARVGLSDLYVEPSTRYLRSRGSEVRVRSPVRRVLMERKRCAGVLLADGARLPARAVILAVPPRNMVEILMPEMASDPFFAGASRLDVSPIVSVYLWFGAPVVGDLEFACLVGGTWHWLFNRRPVAGDRGGLYGVTLVCSAARDMVDRPREALLRSALNDLHLYFPGSRRAPLRHSLVVKEKRATFSVSRGTMRLRPSFRTPHPGLHLAGDWTATGLPATIEGAALSGHACSRDVLGDSGG